jgi:acetyltransferase-like isoleucine patch superfamily enzyme
MLQRLKSRFQLTPAPGFVVALYLSLRWRCRVSPAAVIRFPFKLSIGKGSRIERCSIVASGEGISLGESVDLYDGTVLNALDGKISIGHHSAFGPHVAIYGLGSACIGNYVAIAAHSTVVASNHNFSDRKTYIRLQGSTGKGISIEDDVWIGSNCVILDGVTIGKGSVVAAGAIVNKNVAPYTVVGGVPARFIKER